MTPFDRELMAYHDGELSPRERARVAARLASDRAARQRLADLCEMRRMVRAWADSKRESFDVSAEVMRAISAPERPRVRWVPAAVAASVAAAAVLVVVLRRPVVEPELAARSSEPPALAKSPVEASRGGEERPGAQVESVDFGERSGSIFVLNSSAGTTTVIWMNDPPDKRPRIESL